MLVVCFSQSRCQNFGPGLFFIISLRCGIGRAANQTVFFFQLVNILLQNGSARQRTEHTADFCRLFQYHLVEGLFSFVGKNMQLPEDV